MRFAGLIASVALFAPNIVAAEDTFVWKNVAEWQIRVDPSLGLGCFVLGVFERGTLLRIGLNPTSKNGYLVLANPDWASLKAGKDYGLTIQFDSESPWDVPARGVNLGGSTMLLAKFSDTRFLSEFSAKHSIRITYEGKPVGMLSLRGSAAATSELINCQLAAEAARTGQDPFREGPKSGGNDPFE